MRVLGIDPGTRFLGYGVVEERSGALRHIAHGVVRADPKAPVAERLNQIFGELTQAMNVFRPEVVAVEGVFAFKNARSALILGHARGVALLVAAQSGVPVFEYPPARVKKSVGAGGNNGKEAVARMVMTFLKLTEVERHDATDALAVAICHLSYSKLAQLGAPGSPSKPKKNRVALADFAGRLAPSYQRFGAAK